MSLPLCLPEVELDETCASPSMIFPASESPTLGSRHLFNSQSGWVYISQVGSTSPKNLFDNKFDLLNSNIVGELILDSGALYELNDAWTAENCFASSFIDSFVSTPLILSTSFRTLGWPVKNVESTEEEDIHKIQAKVAAAFAGQSKVQSIYTSRYRNELEFIVFLSIAQYDDSLMDKLLDDEYKLQKQYRESNYALNFNYIPQIVEQSAQLVHPQSKIILSR